MRKSVGRSKPGTSTSAATATVSPSRRIVIPLSGYDESEESDNLDENLQAPRTRSRRAQEYQEDTDGAFIKHDPEAEPVVIPDPDSSPPIIVSEWRGGRTPTHAHQNDEHGQGGGSNSGTDEEFILGLESSESRISTRRNSIEEEVNQPSGRPGRRTSLSTASLKSKTKSRIGKRPGPKSRTRLTTGKRTTTHASRSSSTSPLKWSRDSSPTPKRRRRRRRRARYTLTKEDLKEALEKALIDSDSEEDLNEDKFRPVHKGHSTSISSAAASTPAPTKSVKVTAKQSRPSPVDAKPQINDDDDDRIVVELRDHQNSDKPITVRISKESLDLIRRPRQPPSSEASTSSGYPGSATVSIESTSPKLKNLRTQAAKRAWITRRRNAALNMSRAYKTLIGAKGKSQVKLFDMGFVQGSKATTSTTTSFRINAEKYVLLIKRLGSSYQQNHLQKFNPESIQVQKMVQKFFQPEVPTVNDIELKRLIRRFGLKPCKVKLEDIGGMLVMCPICEQSVPIVSLARHKAEHRIRCHYPDCGMNVLLDDVICHGVSHISGIGVIRCERCEFQTKTKAAMWCHQNKHYGVKPLICKACGDSFSFITGLYSHNKLKHTATGMKMNAKPVVAERTSPVKKSVTIMPLPGLFNCQYCDKSFRTRARKEIHERTHVGDDDDDDMDPIDMCEIVQE